MTHPGFGGGYIKAEVMHGIPSAHSNQRILGVHAFLVVGARTVYRVPQTSNPNIKYVAWDDDRIFLTANQVKPYILTVFYI